MEEKSKNDLTKENKGNHLKHIMEIIQREKELFLEGAKKIEYIIYYSSYGYIKIDKEEIDSKQPLLNFVQYRNNINEKDKPLKGKIFHSNIKSTINIKIKTFFNKRLFHSINDIDIYTSIHSVIKKMIEKEKEHRKLDNEKNDKGDDKEVISEQNQYMLISCHKKIHELDQMKNIYENDIQDNEILIYLPAKPLSFSEFSKGYSIKLSQDGKIATKINHDEQQYVYGNRGYSFGKHYFEINLLTEPIERSIIVGISTKNNPRDEFDYHYKTFYGYVLSDLQKIKIINDKEEKRDYGSEPVAINDIIGVLFEFKKDGVELSFYKNKIWLGVAFSKLYRNDIYFPTVFLGYLGSKVQISNQIDFPELC